MLPVTVESKQAMVANWKIKALTKLNLQCISVSGSQCTMAINIQAFSENYIANGQLN